MPAVQPEAFALRDPGAHIRYPSVGFMVFKDPRLAKDLGVPRAPGGLAPADGQLLCGGE